MAIYKTVECDVLVVGGAACGCGAAINARDFAQRVVLVDKGKVGRSGVSPFAAGIWTVRLPEDDADVWMKEVLRYGEYLNDQEWVKIWLDRIYPTTMELDKWGEEYGIKVFEKDDKGNFVRIKARAHLDTMCSLINAIPMMDVLTRKAREKGVEFIERTIVTNLVMSDGRVVGAVGFNYRTGDIYLFKAKAVIAAAGKHYFGGLFMGTMNLSGDLIAAAYGVGAEIFKLEMCISNCCARDFATHGMNLIVSSGGRFLNQRGEEFLWEYDPVLGNRSGLPTLSIAFANEVKEGRGPIYLDMSRATPEDQQRMRKLLPETFETLDKADIDFFKDKIPWIPDLEGGGGVHVNTRCESSVPGLYAAGDNAGQPQTGTTTIGATHLCSAYMSGCIAGQNAGKHASTVKDPVLGEADLDKQVQKAIAEFTAPLDRSGGIEPRQVIRKIQGTIMPWPVAYIKNRERLTKAIAEIEQIRHEDIPAMKAADLRALAKAQEAKSFGLIAELMLRSALFRQESRGYQYREDYPYTDNRNWLKWVMIKKEAEKPEVWAKDVPTPYFRPGDPITVPPGVRKTKGGA